MWGGRSVARNWCVRMWRLKLEARSWEGQQVEARIGCAILNRMIHLGKPESYQVEVRSCSLGRTGKHANTRFVHQSQFNAEVEN